MPSPSRRQFLATSAAAIAAPVAAGVPRAAAADAPPAAAADHAPSGRTTNHIGLASYSLWQFRNDDLRDMEKNLELAADWGFAGVEVLHHQIEREGPAYFQRIKRRASRLGLDLYGMATHQTFLTPDENKLRQNVEMTILYLEQCYQLGIPTMRVQTGTWGTSKNFDDLMAHRGIEPALPGHNDEEAFKWVIDAFQQCIPTAEKCGVTMGLENHWGLGRTPQGMLRIIEAVNSPWLQATCDVGNFLEDPYDRLDMVLPHASMVHMKTYYGGGLWYTLDLDYDRLAKQIRGHNYRGYLSLEFEGKEDAHTAVPKSLAMLRKAFAA